MNLKQDAQFVDQVPADFVGMPVVAAVAFAALFAGMEFVVQLAVVEMEDVVKEKGRKKQK